MTNIIKKEKERQKENLEFRYKGSLSRDWKQHKKYLINLKEYMEELDVELSNLNVTNWILSKRIRLGEDIKKLTEMIEKYEN